MCCPVLHMYHVSCAMCHVPCVMCHVSCIMYHALSFMELSARTGAHVESALHTLLRAILHKQAPTRSIITTSHAAVVKLDEKAMQKKACCS